MLRNHKLFLCYLAALTVNFYILPFLIVDTGSAMLMLLIVLPCITFVLGMIWGIWKGFCLWLTPITAILFFPTVFLYYNLSAWVYILTYSGLTLTGNGLGSLLTCRKCRKQQKDI